MEFKSMPDSELVELSHQLASSVSYYNAAEGDWGKETAARNECKDKFYKVRAEMRERGLEFVNKGYLL